MAKYCFLLLAMAACCYAQAQDDNNYDTTMRMRVYHDGRLNDAVPPYGLQKIRAMISAITEVSKDNSDEGIKALAQKTYLGLGLREKFTYNILNPESYSQNCDVSMAVKGEDKKIFGQLLDGFGEYNWSGHQRSFFLANRDSVIVFLKECITNDKAIGLTYKHVIVDINAKELIPIIVSTYNLQKTDHDMLTVLMLLMRDGEYPEFVTSQTFKKLYADDVERAFEASINFNAENEALIIKRATDYYNSLGK